MAPALALAVAIAVGPASAQRVTLNVTDASLADVARSLQQMTGVKITGAGVAAESARPITITIDARDMPLKGVMRHICAQAGVHFVRNQTDYFLKSGPAVDGRPCVRVDGYEVYLESIDVNRWAYVDLRRPEDSQGGSDSLRAHIAVEAEDDEMMAAVLSTVSNLVVELDTGDVLAQVGTAEPDGPPHRGLSSSALRQSIMGASGSFPFPPPEAGRIVAVNGELRVYADLPAFDFALDPSQAGVTRRRGDIALTLTDIDLKRPQATFRLSVPDTPADEDDKCVRLAVVTAFDRQGVASISKDHWWPQHMTTEDGIRTFTQTIHFDWDDGYVPTTLQYHGILAGPAIRQLPYRLEDLPLPRLSPVQ